MSSSRPPSQTPRTDAAERFFHDSGKPRIGFVDSGVSRKLELELAQATARLKSHGVELPESADSAAPPSSPSARKPSMFGAPSKPADPDQPPSAAQQVQLLPAVLAAGSLGDSQSYEAGSTLYRRGERTEHVFILQQGQLQLTQAQGGSPDRLLGPGTVLGEHGLFAADVHTESITAVGPVRCAMIRTDPLLALLAADTSVLPLALMALVLQYRQVAHITASLAAGWPLVQFEVMNSKPLSLTELHRALVEAQTQAPGTGLSPDQHLCLKLQASELLSTRLMRADMPLGSPNDRESLGTGLMLVQGEALAQLGEHRVQLGQGSVIGLAEGLTGQPFGWTFATAQDSDARVFPLDRVLGRLERSDPVLRALASHLCALTLSMQRNFRD
jgi:CRP-like cAMP-binding protein